MDGTEVPTGTPKETADQIILKWDPNNPEIRTRSVELILEPLVIQVTTLVNTEGPSKKRKGQSKRAHALVAAIKKSTELFIKSGEEVAHENLDIEQEMLVAVDEVRRSGEAMSTTAGEFADDPYSSLKRGNMTRAARNLLSAVTRLLILADMVDVHLLLKSLRVVENDLVTLKTASNQTEIMNSIRNFERNASELMSAAASRQQELKDSQLRDDLAAARALLKKYSTMFLTASKVFVNHPELAAVNVNREFVIRQVCQAMNTISDVTHGKATGLGDPHDRPGDLATALDDFDEMIMEPLDYNEVQNRASLERRLETVIRGVMLMAELSGTRNDRRERIFAECKAVGQALEDLFSEYMSNIGRKDKSEGLKRAIEHMYRNTRGLRSQLRKAVVDQVFDSFMETNVSLMVLIQAAEAGNEKEFEDYAQAFTEHANKLGEVANLACSMPGYKDKVKMVRCAAAELENLSPQVIIAARILTVRPKSKVALENMKAFREDWENQVRILTKAVDDITTIDDFLAVYEKHILNDLKKCILVLQGGEAGSLDRIAGVIRGRASRVVSVVTSKMSNYEHGAYTERVREAVKNLRVIFIPNFAHEVKVAAEAFFVNSSNNDIDEMKFIDASRLVYDGVREIRRAVLMNRADNELDHEDVELLEYNSVTIGQTGTGDHNVDECPDMSVITNAREVIRKMTEADKEIITKHIECFRIEKCEFDQEMSKWDDQGNDIIIIAKRMYIIMMEMTDFTLGRGPLKTAMDVINAAKKISEAGTTLDKLARQIADQCQESSTKKDLLAYLQRIPLYCHQLNITSKVKADVHNFDGELIVQGLDSATSLIQAAKNLMNAMVLTVKCSYVASTKYPRHETVSLPIVWRLKGLEEKLLALK